MATKLQTQTTESMVHQYKYESIVLLPKNEPMYCIFMILVFLSLLHIVRLSSGRPFPLDLHKKPYDSILLA